MKNNLEINDKSLDFLTTIDVIYITIKRKDMTHIQTNELTFNKKVKSLINNIKTVKKHVAGIGYVFYFDGGHIHKSNGQMVITFK